MSQNPPDERLVYLAFKNIFSGQDAHLRRQRRIHQLIRQNQNNDDVQPLIQEHNIANVEKTAEALLREGIFASTLRAKIKFPEVFDVSSVQSAERAASEVEVAQSETDTIKQAAEGHLYNFLTPLTDSNSNVFGM